MLWNTNDPFLQYFSRVNRFLLARHNFEDWAICIVFTRNCSISYFISHLIACKYRLFSAQNCEVVAENGG